MYIQSHNVHGPYLNVLCHHLIKSSHEVFILTTLDVFRPSLHDCQLQDKTYALLLKPEFPVFFYCLILYMVSVFPLNSIYSSCGLPGLPLHSPQHFPSHPPPLPHYCLLLPPPHPHPFNIKNYM